VKIADIEGGLPLASFFNLRSMYHTSLTDPVTIQNFFLILWRVSWV